jgi:hypothetical protein
VGTRITYSLTIARLGTGRAREQAALFPQASDSTKSRLCFRKKRSKLLRGRFGWNALQLDDLIDEKQIRKQSAQVNRGVQIVDQL